MKTAPSETSSPNQVNAEDLQKILEGGIIPEYIRQFSDTDFGFFTLRNAVVIGDLNVEKGRDRNKLAMFDFIDTTFTGWVNLRTDNQNPNSISFIRCQFQKSITITDGQYEYLSFSNCHLSENLTINSGVFNKVKIEVQDKELEGDIHISGGSYKELDIENCLLKRLRFDLDRIEGIIRIDNSSIAGLDVSGKLSKDSLLRVSNVYCRDFEFSNFQNAGILEIFTLLCDKSLPVLPYKPSKWTRLPKASIQFLHHYYEAATFAIFQSDLGTCHISNTDFKTFDKFIIKHSNLSTCSYSIVKWPDKIDPFYVSNTRDCTTRLMMGLTHEILEDHDEKREIYRQLKYTANKQNDFINEQFFHGLEMKSYYKTLKFKSSDFFTKAVIYFSHLTSNFGQSLSRPLCALLIGHCVLFFMALIFGALNPLHLSVYHSTWKGFEIGFEKYFAFINPLRKNDVSLSGYFILLDILMRVWSSYMIYNIIRATRRFLK